MELYLARHGHVDYDHSIDLFAASLTELGQTQSLQLAEMCKRLDIRFLISSTMIRAEETANIILAEIPDMTRWDLEEFQAVNVDDLMLDPFGHPVMAQWTEDQVITGQKRAWIRVTAVMPRIEIFMDNYGFERVLIVAHEDVIQMMMLAWQGKDWRSLDECPPLDFGAVTRIVLEDGQAFIGPVNVAPGEL